MADFNVTIKRHNGSTWEAIYPKTIAENIISGVLADSRIPSLAASKITSGVFDVGRIPSLDASKINAGTFDVARIPNLNTAKITSGVFTDTRIPNLDAGKITTGQFGTARIPNLDAGKITSGTIDVSRLPAIALTNVMTATTMASFLPIYSAGPTSVQEGDVLILTTDKKTYIHNGGTAGTAADFTLLETPTDLVTSVAGKTGVVTLVKGDVGLGNVDNTSDVNKPVSTAQAAAIATKVTTNTAITGATKTKITYDSKGLVTSGADLAASDIPTLDATKIGSGVFADARIPVLPTSKILGLDTSLNSKQGKITVITSGTIPTPADGWNDGDIIFHTA